MFFYFDIIIKTCGESETLKKKKAEHIKDYINLFLKIYDDSNIVFRENFYNKYIDYIRKQIVKKGPFIHVLLCSQIQIINQIKKTPKYIPYYNKINLTLFPDYLNFVKNPIQFQDIYNDLERNIRYHLYGDLIDAMFQVVENALIYDVRNKDIVNNDTNFQLNSFYQQTLQFKEVLTDYLYKASLDVIELIKRNNLLNNKSDIIINKVLTNKSIIR